MTFIPWKEAIKKPVGELLDKGPLIHFDPKAKGVKIYGPKKKKDKKQV